MNPTDPPRPHHLNVASERNAVARTAAFYRDLLDLTPVELPRDEGAYAADIHTFEDRAGYQYHFVPAEPGFTERQGLPVNPLMGHLAFCVDDIAAVTSALSPCSIRGPRSVSIHDPAAPAATACSAAAGSRPSRSANASASAAATT